MFISAIGLSINMPNRLFNKILPDCHFIKLKREICSESFDFRRDFVS